MRNIFRSLGGSAVSRISWRVTSKMNNRPRYPGGRNDAASFWSSSKKIKRPQFLAKTPEIFSNITEDSDWP